MDASDAYYLMLKSSEAGNDELICWWVSTWQRTLYVQIPWLEEFATHFSLAAFLRGKQWARFQRNLLIFLLFLWKNKSLKSRLIPIYFCDSDFLFFCIGAMRNGTIRQFMVFFVYAWRQMNTKSYVMRRFVYPSVEEKKICWFFNKLILLFRFSFRVVKGD